MRAGFVTLLTIFASTFSLVAVGAAQQPGQQQQQQPAASQVNQNAAVQQPGAQRPAAVRPPTNEQQRVADQRNLSAQPMPAAVRKPMQPEWAATISQKHADYIKQLLGHWEKSLSLIHI